MFNDREQHTPMSFVFLASLLLAAPQAVDNSWPAPPPNEDLNANMTYAEYSQQMDPSSHTYVPIPNSVSKRDWNGPVDTTTANNFALMMQLAVSSYCPSTTNSKTWNCGVRCQGSLSGTVIVGSHENYASGAAGFVGYNPDQKMIVVSVRGTANIQSCIQDIQLWKTPADFGGFPNNQAPSSAQIHQGFKNTYIDLQPTLQSGLETLAAQYPDYHIIFSGHSLGGAVVNLAALDFYQNNPQYADRISIYTFGEPRIGNLDFANYIDSLPYAQRIFRVAKSGDIVPHLPPESFFNFAHHIDNFEITRFGTTTNFCVTTGPAGESSSCSSDTTLLNLVDHITGYYGWWTYPWFC
ncbi:hypothetical protein HK103_005994 [Boothiomyces macroporosus]|uniref:Fungal lipase-type domain-containing protein n=1 Tax=Boothiomyces macroporosus TaxID=261099 RepID=A0AAD5YAR2_9FUNG|nr:hypothetical protein HK103_005994 [Boothiomyces macroporosus]